MADVSVLAGFTEPLTKLVEVTAQGIGAIARPWLLGRDVKAIIEARQVLDEAGLEIDALQIPGLSGQVKASVEFREARRLLNTHAVVEAARKALPATASDAPVEPDWTSRFFSAAQEVSTESLQEMWGQLLARETSSPGAVSLRTLDVLRNLSAAEARAFQRVASVCINDWLPDPHSLVIPSFQPKPEVAHFQPTNESVKGLFSSVGVSMGDLQSLDDAGLIHTHGMKGLSYPVRGGLRVFRTLGVRAFLLDFGTHVSTVDVPVLPLSAAGRELARSIEAKPSVLLDDFFVGVASAAGIKCSVGSVQNSESETVFVAD